MVIRSVDCVASHLFPRLDFLLPGLLGCFLLCCLNPLLLALAKSSQILMPCTVIERNFLDRVRRLPLLGWRGQKWLLGSRFCEHVAVGRSLLLGACVLMGIQQCILESV